MTNKLCIKHQAANDMHGKGFDSEQQRRWLFHMYSIGDPHYQWVPEIWDKHGGPSANKVDGPWEAPYGCWICGAEKEFNNILKKQGDTKMNWLTEFADSEEVKEIARKVDANFLDRVKKVHELNDITGSTMKWATVEEALDDFARRNNLDNLQKRAISRRVNLQKIGISLEELEKDGIDNEQAIEFMSKSKNKHKEISKEDGKKIIKEKREKERKLPAVTDTSADDDQKDAFTSNGQEGHMAKVDNNKIEIKSFCKKSKK